MGLSKKTKTFLLRKFFKGFCNTRFQFHDSTILLSIRKPVQIVVDNQVIVFIQRR